ncbi:MAG: dienelactone hydrolase family protein [Planctomycetota bacterium]|nr:dienelactone hydrolase family protein [Planctomycetota bacterium]
MRSLLLLVALLLALVPAAPLEAADDLDRKQKKAIADLAMRWFEARPKTKFEKWDRAKRQALVKEAKAFGAIPESSLGDVVELIWKAVKKNALKPKNNTFPTPYGKPAEWRQSGRGGAKSGLVIGMHGGGVGAGSMDEAAGKWKLPKCLHMFPQGIRLIHDTWNSVHGERFLLTLIELAKTRYEIDPDRVYAMGFSMGGTGSWFLAGRHPDLLAGAIPAHGVLMAEKVKQKDPDKIGGFQHGFVPNARNLAVYFYTGSEDKNCEPGTFIHGWRVIEALKKDDPDGYKDIRFQLHEGIAHSFPPGEPTKGFKYIQQFKRNTFPKTLFWEYAEDWWPQADNEDKVDRLWKQWFYWLYCHYPRDRMQVRATLRKTEDANEIDLDATIVDAIDFTIYLNPEMIDVNRPVIVRFGGKEVWRGTPKPDLVTVFESLDARVDRRMVFDRRIVLDDE